MSLYMAFEESEPLLSDLEREENLIAAAGQIAMALRSKKILTSHAKKILGNLSMQLSSMTMLSEKEEEEEQVRDTAYEYRLIAIEKIIMRWEEGQSIVWDSGPDQTSAYLNAADEVRGLIEELENLHLSEEDQEYKILLKAYGILQLAMARLEEQFRNLLIQYNQHFESEFLPFRSSEVRSYEESLDNGSYGESFQTDTISRASQEHVVDLLHPDMTLREVRCIANLMFACNYDQQCSDAYTIARRDAFGKCPLILEMERLSTENVFTMEWDDLNSKIKRWIWAVKIIVRVYLTRERWLSEQIFGEGEPVSLVCFVDASKASILQILNFCEGGPHKPEKLFRYLDMYEVLASLKPDIDSLYPDEVDSSVRLACRGVLKRLGNWVRATCLVFENSIAPDASSTPFGGGGIHPLARYVMNYVKLLNDYHEKLDLLMQDQEEEDAILLLPYTRLGTKEESKSEGSPGIVSLMTLHIQSVASILECKLDDKSKLYKEAVFQHLFLMNNIHYVAQEVNGSGLRLIFGDEWLREQSGKYWQHATNYLRTSFSSILSMLKDEGIQISGTNSISKSVLKERLKSFYLAFENLYSIQTARYISDVQLREELRSYLSRMLVQAYWTFIERHRKLLDIKYSADDLEIYLLDFFEGVPKRLPNFHRR